MNELLPQLLPSQLLGQDNDHVHWLSDKIGIHQAMVESYQQMQLAARKDNIELVIASGWRGFERQLQIWNNKFLALIPVKSLNGDNVDISQLSEQEKIKAILTYSALPGASRHHWGTDIDVYAPNLLPKEAQLQLEPWEYNETGPFFPLTQWLKQHAHTFGFYLPYDCYRGGIAHEPWHLSFAPLADYFEQQFTVALLTSAIEAAKIEGKRAIIEQLDEIYQNFIININHNEKK